MTGKNNTQYALFNKHLTVLVCLFLVAATLVVYWQVQSYDFVNLDDQLYVYDNRHVQSVLKLETIVWAFSFSDKDKTYWHPITWLSHILDYQLYGLQPGKHHQTNLLIHLANSLLLFIVFKLMTRAFWQSAFVAALFALHPINVDTVAWIAERKNVLSTFFWMLTMLTYIYYSKEPVFHRYLLIFPAYALGLMAKPMLVTLPFVLLLLDYWPLRRISFCQLYDNKNGETIKDIISGLKGSPFLLLVLEKIPLLIISVISICLSSLSVRDYVPLSLVPMKLRIANALLSYVKYIGKMIWPRDLAVLYPYPNSVPMWLTIGSLFLLVCISGFFIREIRESPYLIIGWLWYLGTLVPVIGLVQGGLWPAMADRFVYVPFIGLFIIVAWGVPKFVSKWRRKKKVLITLAAVSLSVLTAVTWKQVGYWENSITLFTHTLSITTDNYISHYNLGNALSNQGRVKEAIDHYLKALRIKPDYVDAHNNLGLALGKQGHTTEAITHYRQALRIKPYYEIAYNNLGNTLSNQGRLEEAIGNYLDALRIKPDYVEAHNNLGNAFKKQGRIAEAIEHYLQALRINSNFEEAHYNLGNVLDKQGHTEEAITHYLEALRIKPDFVDVHNNLGSALSKQGRLEEAITHYLKVLSIKPHSEKTHNNLGNVLNKQGRTKEAVAHYLQALRIKPNYAEAHNNLGNALNKQGRTDEAVEHYLQALRIKPNYVNAHYNLGVALFYKGDIEGAIACFNEALRIKPDHIHARNNLKKVLVIKRQNQ